MTKQHQPKTNAMRLLEKHGVPYTTFVYPESIHSAEQVAQLLGVPASHVLKTLVTLAEGDRRLLIMVPGDRELAMRLAAHEVHAKQLQMASQREAERLTGLKVGGISPLALLDKRFEIYLDASAAQLEAIHLNAGQRGLNVRLRVLDLLAVTKAAVITATMPPDVTHLEN